MPKFVFNIVQHNSWELEIEAEDEDAARAEFDEYIVEDFGDPQNSSLEYEVMEC